MLRLYGCIVHEHDLRLVALAGIVALFGSHTAIALLRHVATQRGRAQRLWLAGAALAAGSAIWATHFVAMLAFAPGLGAGYDPLLTLLSFVFAVLLTGAGFAVAVAWREPVLGGVIVGLGITAMHYTGMMGFEVSGRLTWDPTMVAFSVLAGCGLAAIALPIGLGSVGRVGRGFAAGLLALAVCADHFTGMAAVTVTLEAGQALAGHALGADMLAVAVAVACLVILGLAAAGLEYQRRARRQRQAETANLRELADIAVEGLLVCDGDRVVAANRSFCAMSGRGAETLAGTSLAALFVPQPGPEHQADRERPGTAPERLLRAAHGDPIPVEMVCKQIDYAGRPHCVVALRDLRERQRAEREIRFLAHHDSLTSLANRAAFAARLDQLCRGGGDVLPDLAVLAIDLDRFKPVNDVLGHPFGDLLLVCVAERLRSVVRDGDLVARLGGDEFAVVQCGALGAEEMASRIVELLSRPFGIEGKTVSIGASVGVAFCPQHGDSPALLMKNADLALYAAKAAGRGRVTIFDADMGARVRQRRHLELDLHQALARDELRLRYQPQFTFARNQVTSFEALLRWQHPQLGLIGPSTFLALAEETGLIVAIGEWVLRQATAQAAEWGQDVGVAVNLAPAQFEGAGPLPAVRAALQASGLPPRLLELEVTERVLLHDGAAAVAMLHDLRAIGVRISMDDFGTGHSSLTQLRSFPFDQIKIDRSFVSAPESDAECAAIVQAVIGLGRSLGISTIAEGVETAEQMARVQRFGCDSAQGYLIGCPMPAEEARRLLYRPRLHVAA